MPDLQRNYLGIFADQQLQKLNNLQNELDFLKMKISLRDLENLRIELEKLKTKKLGKSSSGGRFGGEDPDEITLFGQELEKLLVEFKNLKSEKLGKSSSGGRFGGENPDAIRASEQSSNGDPDEIRLFDRNIENLKNEFEKNKKPTFCFQDKILCF